MSKFHFSNTRRGAAGFTLVEVMAATAIMLIVVTLVLTLTTNVLTAWNRSSGKLSSNYEARQALDILATDIESAIIRSDGKPWMRVEEAASGSGSYVNSNHRLLFFAPSIIRARADGSGTALLGDVAAVQYRIYYQNPINPANTAAGKRRYGLYRAVVPPQTTFNTILADIHDSASPVDIPTAWNQSMPVLDDTYTLNTANADSYTYEPMNLLVSNVVALDVTLGFSWGTSDFGIISPSMAAGPRYPGLSPDPSPDPAASPTGNPSLDLQYIGYADFDVPMDIDGDGVHEGDYNNDGTTDTPVWLKVELTVISDEGAARLRAVDEGGGLDQTTFDELITEFGSVYTRTIDLHPSPF